MGVERVWPWVLILLDLAAVWLLVRPSNLGKDDWSRFIARLLAVIFFCMQVAEWEEQSKNTNVEPIMHWFSIAFGIGAVAFLGYHFVRLFTSESALQTETPERRYLLPECEEEARIRYRAAWQKYRKFRVLFPIALLGLLPFVGLIGAVFGLLHLGGKVWGTVWAILVLAWIALIQVLGCQWAFWRCPRCGFPFKGSLDSFFPKRCRYCDLPKWAESPDQ